MVKSSEKRESMGHNENPPGNVKKKAYSRPKVAVLGQVAEMTRGENGSNFDPGHSAPTKLGNG